MDEWKAGLRKRFVEKYGAEPEEDAALWRIWKRSWESRKPSTWSRQMPTRLRKKIRAKIDEADAIANEELKKYQAGIEPKYSMPEPRKWTYVQRGAGYKAKAEFFSLYGIYPYEDVTKVKVWCEILDKYRRKDIPRGTGKRKRKDSSTGSNNRSIKNSTTASRGSRGRRRAAKEIK